MIGGGPPDDALEPGFAGGIRDFGTGTLAMLHGEEAVLTKDQLQRLTTNTVIPSEFEGK